MEPNDNNKQRNTEEQAASTARGSDRAVGVDSAFERRAREIRTRPRADRSPNLSNYRILSFVLRGLMIFMIILALSRLSITTFRPVDEQILELLQSAIFAFLARMAQVGANHWDQMDKLEKLEMRMYASNHPNSDKMSRWEMEAILTMYRQKYQQD